MKVQWISRFWNYAPCALLCAGITRPAIRRGPYFRYNLGIFTDN
jgi:hypothetical protein